MDIFCSAALMLLIPMTHSQVALWLATPAAPTLTQTPDPDRRLLDVIVFYGEPRRIERYPHDVRQELQRYLQRFRGYRPRPRPPRLGSEMTMVYAAREGYEAKLVAAAAGTRVERLAQDYVDRLLPCYEWEGFHDCPEREAIFAEQYLAENPDSPFRAFLPLLAAHRWLCTADGYDYEQQPAGAERARRAYERTLSSARESRSALMRAAAEELRATKRCHTSDPFRGRR